MAKINLEGGHRIKRALTYLITRVALQKKIKVPMIDIIATLMSIMVHSGGAHRVESAVKTAFDSILRRHGAMVEDIILRVISEFKSQRIFEERTSA